MMVSTLRRFRSVVSSVLNSPLASSDLAAEVLEPKRARPFLPKHEAT